MTFWNEPLRKFRYLVNFGGSQRVECKSVTLPQFQTDVIEYKLVNHNIKYPGIGKWSDCNMKFIITKDLLQDVFVGVTGYANITSLGNTLSKHIFGTPPTITILDAEGETVQTWSLQRAFISTINFGELAYQSDDLVEVDVTIALDYASISRSV